MPPVSPAAVAAVPPPPSEGDPWAGLDPCCCAGVDEVGRGCLFGPVFAAAVVLPAASLPPLVSAGLTDSKKLSARRREELVPLIRQRAVHWSLGQASAAEIDRWGIRAATERAMLRALHRLPSPPRMLLVDGSLPLRGWSGTQRTLISGDSRCPAIAAASVLAKVERDALLERLAVFFPGYGLERHRGYGTAQHQEALRQLGPTPLHRQCFLGFLRAAAAIDSDAPPDEREVRTIAAGGQQGVKDPEIHPRGRGTRPESRPPVAGPPGDGCPAGSRSATSGRWPREPGEG